MSELVLEKNNDLPQGWKFSTLEDITENHDGKRIPISAKLREGIKGKYPYYGASGIIDYVNKSLFDGKYLLIGEDGANLLARKTPIAFIVNGKFWVNNHAHVLTTLGDIPLEFLSYFINSIDLSNWISGTAQPKLNQTNMNKISIPLPPLNEQKRIVEEIEKSLSELEHTKNILKNIKLQLEQSKQSLLKFAFEGKLTKKWRQKNKTNMNDVFKKIEQGKKNQNKKLQNIVPDEDDFFEIPDEWNWIKLGTVSKEIQYGTSEKATTTKSKIPVLRMGNIQDGELNFDKLKYYPNNWKNFKTFELEDGDVLFNRTNSAELVGKTAVYMDCHPTAVFAGYLIRVKLLEGTYIPSLLSNYINSIFGKLYIKTVVTQQVGQANVNSTKLTMMPLPLMSFEEQKEIFSQLELYFSLIKNTKNVVNSLLSKLETLYSTILKKAFEGKLVTQDPNDEPAEILLQKIKQEKEQLIQKQKAPRKKKNVK